MIVNFGASANLPTKFGTFRVFAFKEDAVEHAALVKGEPKGNCVLARVHSECLTGDVFGSIKCDCRAQLETALRRISKEKHGVLIYLRQEGRGIGLVNKIRAYSLQDKGMDTVQANQALGFGVDERDYTVAAQILMLLGVKCVRLLSNNPKKADSLRKNGIDVCKMVPLKTKPTRENKGYLSVKKTKLGHKL